MWGDAAWTRRRDEREERERLHHEQQIERATEIERLIARSDRDLEAVQLIEMAKLLDPDGWNSRATWQQIAERKRREPGANEPANAKNTQTARNMAALAVEHGINKARRAIALVRSWEPQS